MAFSLLDSLLHFAVFIYPYYIMVLCKKAIVIKVQLTGSEAKYKYRPQSLNSTLDFEHIYSKFLTLLHRIWEQRNTSQATQNLKEQ